MGDMTSTQLPTAADFDVLQNRIAVALAKRERLIKSWTASSSSPRPSPKTQEEIDAEDAELFNPTPSGLGLGAPIPKEFLDGDIKRKDLSGNDKLRQLLLGRNPGLNASKPRDAQEKAGSGRRGLKLESSDEEEGRSALGRAKKAKSGNDSSLYEKPLGLKYVTDMRKVKSAIEWKNNAGNKGLSKPATAFQERPAPKTHTPQPKPSSLPPKQFSASSKMPLVDYSSNEDSDGSNKPPTNTIIRKACDEASSLTATAVPLSKREILQNGMKASTKPSHNSSSSYGSKRSSRDSSSDSEPSDMETAIPLALTSDIVVPTTIPPSESNQTAAAEAKKARKRQRRNRQKEKEKRKLQTVLVPKVGSQRPEIVSQGKPVVAKKIKDRLLDANGN